MRKQPSLAVCFPLQREEQLPSQELGEERISSSFSKGRCSSKQLPQEEGQLSSLVKRAPLQPEEQLLLQELEEEQLSCSCGSREGNSSS